MVIFSFEIERKLYNMSKRKRKYNGYKIIEMEK